MHIIKLINSILPSRYQNNKGVAWLAPLLASLGSGLLQGAMSGKGGGQTGYDMPTMTPSPNDAMNQQLSSQFAQNNLLRSQAGQLPEGVEVLLDRIKKAQMLMAYQQMYGMGGKQGIMGDTMAMSSMGGVGPKAMMAQGRTALNDYAQRNAQIQNYIDSIKSTGLMDMTKNVVSDIQRIPRSNEIPWTGQTPQYNMPNSPGVDLGLEKINWFGNQPFNLNIGGTTESGTNNSAPIQSYVTPINTQAYQYGPLETQMSYANPPMSYK